MDEVQEDKGLRNIAIIADLGSLYYSVKRLWPDRRIDFSKLMEHLLGENKLVRAIAYGTEVGSEAEGFKKSLRRVGFSPKYKRHKPIEGGGTFRPSWGIELTLDVVRMLSQTEVVVLCTSSMDYIPLMEYIKACGVWCVICGCNIPKPLMVAADEVIQITESLLLEPYTDSRIIEEPQLAEQTTES